MKAVAIAVALAFAAFAAPAARAAPPGSPWGASYFPDVPLVTQDGQSVRFYRDLVKDRFVVIDFVFSRCTASCPLETAKLARVQRLLGARVGRDIFLYSITLDPEHDTPAALKAYAARFGAGPGWLFLTGKREDIERIRAKLGDRSAWKSHAVGLFVGNDRAGQWTTLSAVDDPGFLAATIQGWMRTPGAAAPSPRSYAEAPPVHLAPGEEVFRTRCAACHTIGGGPSLGPDLRGVTERRDRRWLARFVADPQRMVAEQDPVAVELFTEYGRLTMPGFTLRDDQLDALLSFVEARSRQRPQAPWRVRWSSGRREGRTWRRTPRST